MAQTETCMDNMACVGGFCERLMALDATVRFVGIADYGGKLLTSKYRKGLVPIMDKKETEQYALQTVFRARSRGGFTPQLGNQLYAVSVYEKLVRVTITVNNDLEKEYHNVYILLSIDVGMEHQKVIENKVLPFVIQERQKLFGMTRIFSEKYAEA